MDLKEFLRLVWPDGEHFFVVEQIKEKSSHHHVSTVASAVTRIERLDTAARGNVYYALASFKEAEYDDAKGKRKRRTQANASQLKCFWVDMDCKGKKTDYADQKEAVVDLIRFSSETGLQLPTIIVNSGYGVHAYWVLDAAISAEEWTAAAKQFHKTLTSHGVKHDSSCTSDSARILRPITTHNRKEGAEDREVKIVGGVRDTMSFDDFKSIIGAVTTVPLMSGTPQFIHSDLGLNMEAEAGVEYAPAFIKEVLSECALMNAVGQCKGNVSEPLWHKVLGTLRYTVEGEKLIHIFSKGHPTYTPEGTQAKYDAWSADGPPSCAILTRDSGEMPEHCANCKHAGLGVNPIQLGRPKILMVEQALVQTAGGLFIEKTVEVAAIPASMSNAFKWESDKLWRNVVDKEASKQDGKTVFEWTPFCDFMFYPSNYYRDAADKQHTVWVLREREGVFKEFEISGGSLGAGGAPLFKELGERGVTATSGGAKIHMEAYIINWGNSLKKSSVGIETFMHYGWHGDSILQGETMYRPGGVKETVRLGGDASRMSKYLTPQGDLNAWKRLVNEAYNHKGMEQYQFIMAAGFGSVLMELMNVAGGPTLSAISHTSGHGKTTTLRNAFGIYGCPKEGSEVTLTRQQATFKAIFAVSGLLHSFPVVVDEMTNVDGSELSDIIYIRSQGTPRIRLEGSGNLSPVGYGWSGYMLCSCNKPMTDIIAGSKPGANAELARLIEFNCTNVKKLEKHDADRIFSELNEHYGVAGEVYLPWIVDNLAEVKKLLLDTQRILDKRFGLTGQDRFWSAGYTCAIVGAIIAKRLGLIQFDVAALAGWVDAHLKEMRGEIAESTHTPEELFGLMLKHVSQGFVVTDIEGGRGSGGKEPWIVKDPKGDYTGRVLLRTGTAYMIRAAVQEWCSEKQADMKAIMQAGVSKGWVKHASVSKQYPGKGTNFAMGQVSCYELDWNKLENSTSAVPVLAEVVKICTKGGV